MNLRVSKVVVLALIILLPVLAQASITSSLEMVDQSIRHRNYKQAVKQLQPLLKQNSAEAQYRMAGLYRSGKGVKANLDKATALFKKAAMNGLPEAQYNLASILEKRDPTQRNPVEALMWYQEAADQGYAKAIRKLAYLKKVNEELDNSYTSKDSIFDAIRVNDVNQVRAMIERGVNIDIVDKNSRSTLIAALLAGHREMSQMVLPLSSKLNLADDNGDRPIHIATRNGYKNIVSKLIKNNVNINAQDRLGNTALIIATRHNDTVIINYLLKNNADYRIKNKKNQTAPQIAQTLELHQAKSVFVKNGIKLTAQNKNYTKVDIEAFQKSISNSSSLYKGWPALNIASLLGDSDIAGQMLGQGAKVDARDPEGYSAIHRAAGKGQQDTLKLLILRGGKINAVNNRNETPLYLAAASGHLKTVNLLLKEGADASILTKNKTSPLSVAITNGHERTALALQGENLDKASAHSAMLLAIQYKMQSLSIQLIKNDKLLLFSDNRNRTALWHSADLGLKKVTEALIVRVPTAINVADKNGYTPLARTVLNGFLDTARLLVDNGASVKTVTNEKNTILMLSVLSGNFDQTRFLLSKDLDIDARNILGDTALIMAAAKGLQPMVDALIKSGADTQIRNLDDQNAYDVASNSDHPATAIFIKENSGAVFKLFN